jgi:hypothetical protein
MTNTLQDFLETQRHWDRVSIGQFTGDFVRFAEPRHVEAVFYWVTPGYKRIKKYLVRHGFSLGYYRRQTVILNEPDPELRYLDYSDQKTIAKLKPARMSKAQLAGTFDFETSY